MCFAGKNLCSRLTKKKACIQFEDKYKDITLEKHSKNLKFTVKVKRNNKGYSAGSKDIHRVQRVLDERSNEGIYQRKEYK